MYTIESILFSARIDSSVIRENALRLPEHFVKQYGNELSDTAILSAQYHNKNAWPVTVEKNIHQHYACFRNGWHEFARNFSITEGYFLVFTYLWDSKFKVAIYDLNKDKVTDSTSLTIPQELKTRKESMLLHSSSNEGEEDQEMSNTIHQKTSTLMRILPKSSSASELDSSDNSSDSLEEDTEFKPRLGLSTRTKNYETRGQRKGSRQQNSKSNDHVPHVRSRSAMPRMTDSGHHSRRWRVAKEEDKRREPQEAINFELQNPSCRVAMGSSNISKHSNRNQSYPMLLHSSSDEGEEDQEMPNTIHQKTRGHTQILRKSSSASELDSIDNSNDSLEEDTQFKPRLGRSTWVDCEMGGQRQASKQQNSKSDEPVPRRSRSAMPRKNTDWGHRTRWRIAIEEDKRRAPQEAINVEPQNPSCRVNMGSSNISKHSNMRLPAKFGEAYMEGASEVELMVSDDGKTWTVTCYKSTDLRIILASGWSTFVKDNELKEGDTCVFELINKKNANRVVVLKVTISRAV